MPADKKFYARNGLNLDPRIQEQLSDSSLWDDYGTRLIYNNDTSLYVNTGCRIVRSKTARISIPTLIDKSNLITGSNFIADKWYYTYLSGDNLIKIDTLAPTKSYQNTILTPDVSLQRYHPTLEYRFIGSFKTNSIANIIDFEILGDEVLFKTGKNLIMINGKSSVKTNLDCSFYVPETSKMALVYAENTDTGPKNIGTPILDYAVHNAAGSLRCYIPITNRTITHNTSNKKLSLGILGYIEKI